MSTPEQDKDNREEMEGIARIVWTMFAIFALLIIGLVWVIFK